MLRRFSVFSLAFLFCLSLFPARALADVGNASVLWSGSIDDGSRFGAFVKGGTCYDAAAASLGYDSSRFSDEVKAKLTDPDYGGMFYVFANAFSPVSSPVEIPSWVPAFVTTSSVIADLLNNISGENYPHWSVAVTYSVYDLALRDLMVVLNGGGGGGGTGSTVTNFPEGDYYKIPVNSSSYTGAAIPSSRSQYAELQYFYVHVDGYNNLMSWMHSRYGSSWRLIYQMRYDTSARAFAGVFQGTRSFSIGSGYKITLDGELYIGHLSSVFEDFCILAWQNADYTQGWYNSSRATSSHSPVYFAQYIDPTGCPVVHLPDNLPNGQWPEPDTPVTPTAPELPEPATPTVETPVTPTVPAPVWPDITINIEPDPTPGTTPSGLDYTELLTRINDNLISIDSFARAINSNLNSLRSDLLAEFNGVIDSLRNIYNYLLTIDSVLETHCTHLRNKIEQSAVFIANYMRTLIKWLADQLDFDDLTNVEAPDNSLLTTINEKLGGGTYEPNPIKDESAYYEWLDDLWDRFLLGDNWQSSMGSISGSFSELKTRFPFSVPWDIVALFRLFVHDPVTPVFDLPLYFSPDGSTPVHVDLSPWDSVASLVRPMVFVIFALKLALLSRDLLGGLGADKGGL